MHLKETDMTHTTHCGVPHAYHYQIKTTDRHVIGRFQSVDKQNLANPIFPQNDLFQDFLVVGQSDLGLGEALNI